MKQTLDPSNDVLDRLLEEHLSAPAGELEPSSGFAMSVMESIQAEAAAPPPIPFPWRRLLPGLVAALGGLVAFVILMLRGGTSAGSVAPAHAQSPLLVLRSITAGARLFSPGQMAFCWIVVAACLSAAAIAASFRLTGRSN